MGRSPERGSLELARLYINDINLLANLIHSNHVPEVLEKMGDYGASQAFIILQDQLDGLGLLPYVDRCVAALKENIASHPTTAQTFALDAPSPPSLRSPTLLQDSYRFIRQPKPLWHKPTRDEEWYREAHRRLTDLANCPVIDVQLHDIPPGKKRGWAIKTNNEGRNVVYQFVCGCSCYVDYDYCPNWRPCGTGVCIHPENMFDPSPPPFRR